MNRKNALLISLLISAVGLLLTGCSSDRVAANAPAVVRGAPVIMAEKASVLDRLEAVGTVRAAETSQLASQVMGTILEVRVHEGDRVKRGQVLAVIDDASAQAEVNRAVAAELASRENATATESEFALADSTFQRYQHLFETKTISPLEFDQVKTRQQAALARRDLARAEQAQTQAALDQARTALDYTRIRAPFDGVVTERKLDPGAMASPGLPIVSLENPSHYRLEATINESDLRSIQPGQQVPVSIDAITDAGLTGKVAQIVPSADPGSRTFLIKIELAPNRDLRSGLFGKAQFSRGERRALMVPQTAIVQRGQLQGVYVLDGNRVAGLRYVTLGDAFGPHVEVLTGIQEHEFVVAKPGELDLGGKRIEAQP